MGARLDSGGRTRTEVASRDPWKIRTELRWDYSRFGTIDERSRPLTSGVENQISPD